jgi:hypothetical protein
MAWTRNHTILASIGAAIAGVAAAIFTKRRIGGDRGEVSAAALGRGKTAPGPVGQSGGARSAGPDAMRDPPKEWESVDQSSDESFPASDPAPVNPHVD